MRNDSVSHSTSALEKRLIGYHDSMALILDALVIAPELYTRFARIRYSELINSIIDARAKKQKTVYQALFMHLDGAKTILLIGTIIPLKIKLRLLLIILLRFLGIILLVISVMATMQAQSYNYLWKQVEEQEKKDLPKSVIAGAQTIFEKAKAEKNAPQMMKAYLTMMAYRGEIAPDSIEVDRNYLKAWVEDKTTSVVDKAVLHSILAGLYIEQDFEKGNAYLLASLKDSLTLFEYPAGKLVPMVKVGVTSRLYFMSV